MTASDHDWARWFDSENISPLRITYESLSKSPIETLRALLDTLGLDPNIANNVEIGVAKLADERNKQWAARFRSTYEIP